jgi:hypothetical protein
MALTPFRWISLAAIGCLLAILALVSSAEKGQNDFPSYSRRPAADTAEARLGEIAGGWNQLSQNLAARYRLLQLIDSAKRVATRSPDTGSIRLFVSGEFDAKARVAIDNVLRGARNQRSGNAGGVDVFVLSDTLHFIRGVLRYGFGPEVRFELPTKKSDRCRVYVRTSFRSQLSSALGREGVPQQLLGPCGFYSAFGEPGPLVRQWFVNGAWQYSLAGSWTNAPEPLRYFGEDRFIYKGLSPALNQLNPLAGGPVCMKGDLVTCERIASTFPSRRGRLPIATPEIGMTIGFPRYLNAGLGGYAVEFLSGAVQNLGRERFREFWTSPDSVPVAFEKASGERWGAFVQQWMTARYGVLEAGPRVSAFALAASVILVLIAVVATLRMSVTRTYV